jgi:hypothetical protein
LKIGLINKVDTIKLGERSVRRKFWLNFGGVLVNLDQYLKKFEEGDFGIQKIQKIANNQSISTIIRLYSSYGEAKKTGFYSDTSLNWILSSLQEALNLASFNQASSLLETDINASFSSFWQQLEERNN